MYFYLCHTLPPAQLSTAQAERGFCCQLCNFIKSIWSQWKWYVPIEGHGLHLGQVQTWMPLSPGEGANTLRETRVQRITIVAYYRSVWLSNRKLFQKGF